MRKERGNPNEYNAGDYPIEPDPQSGQPYTVEPNTDSIYFTEPSRHTNRFIFRLIAFLIIISIALILLQSIFFSTENRVCDWE